MKFPGQCALRWQDLRFTTFGRGDFMAEVLIVDGRVAGLSVTFYLERMRRDVLIEDSN